MSKAGRHGGGFSYSDGERSEIPRNRFQKSGNQEVFEVKVTKNEFVIRVDMPGCPVSSFVYRVEGNDVHFSANEPDMSEYGYEGRKYEGTLVFDPMNYEVKKTKAELVNGVMWVTVPKIPVKEADKIEVVERVLNVKIPMNGVV